VLKEQTSADLVFVSKTERSPGRRDAMAKAGRRIRILVGWTEAVLACLFGLSSLGMLIAVVVLWLGDNWSDVAHGLLIAVPVNAIVAVCCFLMARRTWRGAREERRVTLGEYTQAIDTRTRRAGVFDYPTFANVAEFAGRPVVDFDPAEGITEPDQVIYRLRIESPWVEHEEGVRIVDKLSSLLADAEAAATTGLVIGSWDHVGSGETVAPIVEALAAAHGKLPMLTALFIGDITSEESEISWIEQTDVSPLWEAYPDLEHLRLRGGNKLSLGRMRLGQLRSLIVEAGGLPVRVLREITEAELPQLEHLELWLGVEEYGWDGSVADVVQLLHGGQFPELRYLGLRNSEIADEIAVAVAAAPILEQIEVLDLSLGTLGDEGAAALAACPRVSELKLLDIHHHYVSDKYVAALQSLGMELNANDQQKPDEWNGALHRYVAVSE
jgi:hypothetical protein